MASSTRIEARMAVKPQHETILEQEKTLAGQPPLFRVLLLNDDYTPMDFVVTVLERYFFMNREQATLVMLKVHNEGAGLAGVYPKDVAQSKISQVTEFARSHQHPLQCVMEENK
jgi:ATP-dependent Clp protease adaptor protein ClpS